MNTTDHVFEETHIAGQSRCVAETLTDDLLAQRCRHRVFRFGSGYQPRSFIGAFRRLLKDGGLLEDHAGRRRTLYSLRHTYATLALVSGEVDIHTLSRQMGTSVAMLERHYSKLTATMAAARLG